LAYVTGLVNQELLLQNEYLVAENRILKTRLQRRLSGERATLAEIGRRLVRTQRPAASRERGTSATKSFDKTTICAKGNGSKPARYFYPRLVLFSQAATSFSDVFQCH
jgi:hypothetical protein